MKNIFFEHNRQHLSELMQDGVIVLSAYTQSQRGNDAAHAFEQEANFWYLTGIDGPDWWVIIEGQKSWLVAPEIDSVHQVFNGSLSVEDAKRISGIDGVLSRDDAHDMLQHIARTRPTVYTLGPDPHAQHYDFTLNPAGRTMRTYLKKVFADIKDCRQEIATLRAAKQPEEIIAIKHAIKLTTDTFNVIKSQLSALKYEYQVEAEFTYHFKSTGASNHAYDPIVASAGNAVTLHYGKNTDSLQDNTLLLIDIGARVDGYAADITRTYAIGTPTKRQVAVHASVEKAQREIISLLKPGLKVSEYQKAVDHIMTEALIGLGLMKNRDDVDSYRKYFPHAIGHGLGIDVHDSLGRPTEFVHGMVLTVEPGIYIPEEQIGVRIEDDILITATGHQNLSASLSTSL